MKGAFLKYLSFEKRLSSHTITSYSNDLDQFLLFYKSYSFSDDLIKVDKRAVRSWVVELSLQNLSPRSINRKLATLKSFFKYLIKRSLIESNPTSGINSLKTNQEIPQFIKEKDMMFLFDNLELNQDFKGTRDLLILELLYGTGIRISELINLRSSYINFTKKEVKVLGKRNKERIIPLHDNAIIQIKKFIKIKNNLSLETSELICTEKGNKTYPMLISRVVKKHLSSLINSKKYNPHLLRHTFATHILNKGGDLNSIKDLLGHKSLAATQIYTHNSIEKLKETYKKSHPRA
ncbi:MAG: tyrosine-type recombinase/integrase [Cytophagales bacterium]|nr:tyrosine-type recombinase/integrase [Cytophagales bacterium]